MKTFLTFLLLIVMFGPNLAQTNDFLTNKDFQTEKKKITDAVNGLKRTDSDVKKLITSQKNSIDSLSNIISVNKGQIAMNNDSITGFSFKVKALEAQVNKQRMIHRPFLLISLAILYLLVILMIIMLYRNKKRSGEMISSMQEENKKMLENIELEFRLIKESIRQCNDQIISGSGELKQLINSGLSDAGNQIRNLDQILTGYPAIFEAKLNKLTEEKDRQNKELEVKITQTADHFLEEIKAVNTMVEKKNQLLAEEISKLIKKK